MSLAIEFPEAVIDAIAARVVELLKEEQQLATGTPEPWIDAKEAARHCGCSTARIYDLVQRGVLPHGRDGTRVYFQRSALDARLRSES